MNRIDVQFLDPPATFRHEPYRVAVVSKLPLDDSITMETTSSFGSTILQPVGEQITPIYEMPTTRSPTDSSCGSMVESIAPTVVVRRQYRVVVVQFKRGDGVFELPEYSVITETYKTGDYVIVSGDRGEHIGCISSTNLHHRNHITEVGRVLRHATSDEVQIFQDFRARERQLTVDCQVAADHCEVNMAVLDTELQNDGAKLSIYFRTPDGNPVDFRQLQRYLYRIYRCRIWFVTDETAKN